MNKEKKSVDSFTLAYIILALASAALAVKCFVGGRTKAGIVLVALAVAIVAWIFVRLQLKRKNEAKKAAADGPRNAHEL